MPEIELSHIRSQAQALLEAGRHHEALALLTHGLSMAPDDEDLLCLMSEALLDLQQWREAWRYTERAIAVAPENDWAHRLHSIALRNCARRHDAVVAAKEAVRLQPMIPHNWHTLASAQLNIFDLKEARASAEHLRELAPDWELSFQMLALVALKEERYKEAEEHCRRELELNPNSYFGMNNLGVALLNQKRKREAVEHFTRAAKINPQAEVARSNLAAAVGKYLPRVALPFMGIWLLQALVRGVSAGITGTRYSDSVMAAGFTMLVIGAIIGIYGLVFLIRWLRFRSLPQEARAYWKATQKQSYTPGGKRQALYYLIGLTSVMFLVWVAWFVTHFSEPWSLLEFLFPAFWVLLGGTGVFLLRRVRQSEQNV